MRHFVTLEGHGLEFVFFAGIDFQKFDRKIPGISPPGVRESQVYKGIGEFFEAFRADDGQGFFPFGHEIMVQKDKWQSETMVAMEMADEDVLDILQRFPHFPEDWQCSGGGFKKDPSVHQETSIGPARGKGVA